MFKRKKKIVKMSMAKIYIEGNNPHTIDELGKTIKDIAIKAGVEVSGPQPNPVKRATINGKEVKVHSRLIKVYPDEKVLRRILSVNVPEGVKVTMKIEEKEKAIKKV